jgi:hypothetical protein
MELPSASDWLQSRGSRYAHILPRRRRRDGLAAEASQKEFRKGQKSSKETVVRALAIQLRRLILYVQVIPKKTVSAWHGWSARIS